MPGVFVRDVLARSRVALGARGARAQPLLIAQGLMGTGMLSAWWAFAQLYGGSQRVGFPAQGQESGKNRSKHPSTTILLVLILTGVLGRLMAFFAPAILSDDYIRYLWDGAVVLAGHDPYRSVPDLLGSVGGFPMPPDNTQYPTIYPPGALAMFALTARTGVASAVLVWRLVLLFGHLYLLALGTWAARRFGLQKNLPLVVLNPVLLVEGAMGLHLDVLASASLFTSVVIWAVAKRRKANESRSEPGRCSATMLVRVLFAGGSWGSGGSSS